jgi:hypothetical protein
VGGLARLVTQFDEGEARPAVATPSGASCCCCCCCLATAISVSGFTAIHVRSLRLRALEVSPDREPVAQQSAWPETLGALALALALIGGAVGAAAADFGGLAVAAVVWAFLLFFAYRGAGHPFAVAQATATVLVGGVLLAVEFFVALALSDVLGVYIFLSVVAGLGGVFASYMVLRPGDHRRGGTRER